MCMGIKKVFRIAQYNLKMNYMDQNDFNALPNLKFEKF